MQNGPIQLMRLLVPAMAAMLSACSAVSDAVAVSPFSDPSLLVGRRTNLCGLITYSSEDHNLYRSAEDAEKDRNGLGILPGVVTHELLARFDAKYACVEGEVVYRGCAVERICTDSNFPYAIGVDGIRSG